MSTILLNLTGISYTYFTHPVLPRPRLGNPGRAEDRPDRRERGWQIYAAQAHPGAAYAGDRLDLPDQRIKPSAICHKTRDRHV